MQRFLRTLALTILFLLVVSSGYGKTFRLSREEVIEKTLKPYDGASVKGVDTSTLTGKIMCGYQGWFACPGDGSELGWSAWGRWNKAKKKRKFEPGACSIDLWPDVSELDADEKYATSFRHADGSVAYVFSAANRKTVVRHFKWMKEYGIDGAFVQRFVGNTYGAKKPHHYNTMLANCRAGANLHGRTYALMYDLSGLKPGHMPRIIDDWKLLNDKMNLTEDPAYLHHNGKPVISVWGIGFNDNRAYTLKECEEFIDFLKNDEKYGGLTVMVGVPTYWRTLNKDCLSDPKLHEIILKADIVSPWMVGRFWSIDAVAQTEAANMAGDVQWCKEHGKEYLPVMFPGFSWANGHNDEKILDQIPRLGGRFLWKQYVEAKKAGVTMFYQAMFDEVDEGTAIFKCTNDPPIGASKFVTHEGLPSDHYLWLAGQGAKLIRGEIEPTEELPVRQP